MVGVQDAAEALRIKEQQEADEAKVGVRLLLRHMASRASPAHRLHMSSRNRSKQMRRSHCSASVWGTVPVIAGGAA